MLKPMIIISAPNGARRQKTDHPDLPITPQEMAVCAEEILAAGASILHLHVRDNQNAHTLDVGRYHASIKAIREVVGRKLIIQATSEAVGIYSADQQIKMVKELKPEAVSLALREICPTEHDTQRTAKFFTWLKQQQIFPQIILYDEQDVAKFNDYRRRGVFATDNPFVLFVIGRASDNKQRAEQMMKFAKNNDTLWAVCGFGEAEIPLVSFAANNGGHIRVGFENNIKSATGQLLKGHDEMIALCKQTALKVGRKTLNADDVRNFFSL